MIYYLRTKHSYALKFIICMKLMMFLTCICLHVSANVFSQKISLSLKNATLPNILKEIEQKSDFRFVYSSEVLSSDKTLNVNFSNKQIEYVLKEILKGTRLDYSKSANNLIVISAIQQSYVTGTLRDENGAPMAGATVRLRGSNDVTSTDVEGKFKIKIPSSGGALVISYLGYEDYTVNVTASQDLEIQMKPNGDNQIDEIVVVGYNSQNKATVTGSISTIKGSDVVKSPSANVSNSLAGRVPGVILNNRSGEPGYDGSSISIRGAATLNNNDVLIVVDGVPGQIGGLERLNPNDIESFSILKDASASIYGARAANGVIIITTKRGKFGKPTISASYNQSFVQPTRLPKMADAVTWAKLRNELAYANNPAEGQFQEYTAEEIQKFSDGSDPLNYPDTDWQKETLRKFAGQNQANLSVNGGSEGVKYFVSTGYLSQNSLYIDNVTQYKQYSFRSNIDVNVTKELDFGLYINGRQEDRQFPSSSASWIFDNIYRMNATVLPRYPNGLLSYALEGRNPVALQSDIGGTYLNPKQVFNGILKGKFNMDKWVNGLSLDGYFSMDKSWNYSKGFGIPYNLYVYNPVTSEYDPRPMGGLNNKPQLNESQENNSQIVVNAKINYNKQFGDHTLNSFVGYEQTQNKFNSLSAGRINYLSALTPELNNGSPAPKDRSNGGNGFESTRKSYIAKVSYDYLQKYLIDVQGRADASSTFPSYSRWGYFGTLSAGWRVSSETWFPQGGALSDLKLRGSIGTLGNDNVASYQYLTSFVPNNTFVANVNGTNVIQQGLNFGKLANPDITWEVAKKIDLALEGILYKNLNFEFIYFLQKRSDILWARSTGSIPEVVGLSGSIPDENFGKVNSRGVEAMLGYNNRFGELGFNISGNFTFAKNEIIEKNENFSKPEYQWETGGPMWTGNYYQAIGIFRTQEDLDAIGTKYFVPSGYNAKLGDLIYEDVDGNGVINGLDMVRSKYSNQPQITYGFVLGGDYKGFDLSMVFAGQARVNQYIMPLSGADFYNFFSSWADNRWSPENPNGSYPRPVGRIEKDYNGGDYPNTFWLKNTSFFRMKSAELGYKFTLANNSSSRSLRAFVSAFNLFTITGVKDVDPEGDNSIGAFYPQQRIFNIGASISF